MSRKTPEYRWDKGYEQGAVDKKKRVEKWLLARAAQAFSVGLDERARLLRDLSKEVP